MNRQVNDLATSDQGLPQSRSELSGDPVSVSPVDGETAAATGAAVSRGTAVD